MMNGYWPTAGEQENASKHDIEHSRWYNQSMKVVLSTTITNSGLDKTIIISDNLAGNINKLKQQDGKNIVIFGSATATHSLFNEGLIDELWLFVNPVVIGKGIPMFKGVKETTSLTLVESKQFPCGVVGLHYLKYLENKSDEEIVKGFVQNPYWQYFCGCEYFEHKIPIHPTTLVKWRKKIGIQNHQ